jgi:predicted phage baseplate assembly protein
LGSDARARDVVLETEDDGTAWLRFGDGVLGRRPEPDSVFTARYRVGNGPAGNVAADRIVVVLRDGQVDPGLMARNPLPARGGVAPEPLADVRVLAPRAFRTELMRAITVEDYAALAQRDPRVQRAAAQLVWTGSRQLVRIAVDQVGAAELDPGLADDIEDAVQPFRRIGHEVEVVQARYVPLRVSLGLLLRPDARRGDVRAAVLDRLSNRILADGSRGFFHPDNLSFGASVQASRLIAAAHAVTGIAAVELRQLERLFEGPDGELERGFLAIGAFEIARLDNDRNFPEHGHLTLQLRGGR